MRAIPPDEDRCNGTYGEKYRQRPELRGQRCEQPRQPGGDYCGQHHVPDERRCTAHYSPTNPDPGKVGKRCVCWAMKNQRICSFHGGRTPRNLAAAARRTAEGKALKIVQTYGIKITTTATDALLDEVQWTAGHVAWLRERVQEIEKYSGNSDSENPLVWGVTRRKEGGDDRGTTEEAAPSVWLKLYQTERNHLLKVCEAAIRAGVEERRVRLAESQGALLVQVIKAILGDLDLTADQQARIPDIVPRHLRAVAG
jgi:hypothetical protein